MIMVSQVHHQGGLSVRVVSSTNDIFDNQALVWQIMP